MTCRTSTFIASRSLHLHPIVHRVEPSNLHLHHVEETALGAQPPGLQQQLLPSSFHVPTRFAAPSCCLEAIKSFLLGTAM
ncbi:putative plastidial pyruvate kinase 2-like [Sesbania bispinosa]|nr:putative plastidial pyruvate kinase 2-like [Sesbania bispinosa]